MYGFALHEFMFIFHRDINHINKFDEAKKLWVWVCISLAFMQHWSLIFSHAEKMVNWPGAQIHAARQKKNDSRQINVHALNFHVEPGCLSPGDTMEHELQQPPANIVCVCMIFVVSEACDACLFSSAISFFHFSNDTTFYLFIWTLAPERWITAFEFIYVGAV